MSDWICICLRGSLYFYSIGGVFFWIVELGSGLFPEVLECIEVGVVCGQ